MAEMIYSLRLENLNVRAMLDIKRDRVSSLRLHMSLSQEEFRQIRRDRDDARGRLRRLESIIGLAFCFKGTEGVVGLIRWSEKMEIVFTSATVGEISSEVMQLYLLDSALPLVELSHENHRH
ncbi:hypothetical protein Tco_1107979 [Tanacetum coccineum]